MKFSINGIFSKCDQIRSFLPIWSHLLKKSLMENFIFCAVMSRKKSCRLRNVIPVTWRLLLTLTYLTAGESQQSLSFNFRIEKSTVSKIVRKTYEAIWKVLKKDYLKVPSSTNDWVEIAHIFYDKWKFPNYWGAIDCKYVMTECQ